MKYYIIAIILIGLLGYATGRYIQPAKVETHEIQVVKQEVRTITKEITSPDGTITKEVTNETVSEKDNSKDSKVNNVKSQWKAQALVGLDSDFKSLYGIDVEHRFIGPVSAGAWVNTNREFGISVSLEF